MVVQSDVSDLRRLATTGVMTYSQRSAELDRFDKMQKSVLRVGETMDCRDVVAEWAKGSTKRKAPSSSDEPSTRRRNPRSDSPEYPTRIPFASSPSTSKPPRFTSNTTWAKAQLGSVDSTQDQFDKLNSRIDEMTRQAQLERDGMYTWMGEFAQGCQRVINDITLEEEELRGEVDGLRGEVTGLRGELDAVRAQLAKQAGEKELRSDVEGLNVETMGETILQQLRQEFRANVEFLAAMHRVESTAARESIDKLAEELRALRAEVTKRDIVVEENGRSEAIADADEARTKQHRLETIELVKEMVTLETDRLSEGLSNALRSTIPSLVVHALPKALKNGVGPSLTAMERCITKNHSQLETILPHFTQINKINDLLATQSVESSQRLTSLSQDFDEFRALVKTEFGKMKNYSDRSVGNVMNTLVEKWRNDGMQMVGFQAQLNSLCRGGRFGSDGHSTNDDLMQRGRAGTEAQLGGVDRDAGRRAEANLDRIENPQPRSQNRPTWTGPPTPSDLPSSRFSYLRPSSIQQLESRSLSVTIPDLSHSPSLLSTRAASR